MTIVASAGRSKNVYVAGFSGLITVPNDVAVLLVIAQAAGGGSVDSGFGAVTVGHPCGGGGAYVLAEIPVLDTEWGTSISVSVGDGVAGADGNDTTLSGTLNGESVAIVAAGGGVGAALTDGLGGAASGGDTNINGYDASGFVLVPADEQTPGIPGNGGGFDQDLCEDVIGGFGATGLPAGAGDVAGFPGYLVLEWG